MLDYTIWIAHQLTKGNTQQLCVIQRLCYLSEVLQDVVDDDLLSLVGVHSSERVHVDDSILKTNQRTTQSSFQSL